MFGTWPTSHRYTENDLPPEGPCRKCEESYRRDAESWSSPQGSTDRTRRAIWKWGTCCWSLHEDRTWSPDCCWWRRNTASFILQHATQCSRHDEEFGILSWLASSTNTRAALQKLPDPLKEKWGERKIEIHPTIPTLVDLDQWLRTTLRAKTLVSEPLPSHGTLPKGGRSGYRRPPRKGDQGIDHRQELLHSCSTLATDAMTGNQSLLTANTCLICNKKHKIEKCDKFIAMDVNQRDQLGKEKRLCCKSYP